MGKHSEKWEGTIREVLEDRFIAHLCKPGAKQAEIIEGEFSIDAIPSSDRHLVKEGMVFYWNIGKEVKKSGTISNSDCVIFRRVPSWKRFNIDAPNAFADRFFEF